MALNTDTLPQINAQNRVDLKIDPLAAQTEADRAALGGAFSLKNPLVAAGMDIATLPGRGAMGAANTLLRLPRAMGADIPFIPESAFGGDSSSMTPYFDRLRAPAEAPAAPVLGAPVTPAAMPVTPAAPGVAPPATSKTASQSIIDWANQAPTSEQKGTRLALAAKMMGAEAQTTSAAKEPGGRGSMQGLQDIGVETNYNEMGMPVQTTRRSAIYDPATNTMVPTKLPTIAAKASLPPKTELKSGQNYPGYGTWTGTGFRQQ